jgi:type I restriction-modification system DNA methylase subunit
MNITLIQDKLQKLIKALSKDSFIYDLLLAYDLPKSGVTLLRKGNRNMSKIEGEVSWKKKVFFKEIKDADLHLTISDINDSLKHEERFIIVTDYKTLLAIDTKTQDKLDIDFKDLSKHYDFFLPWAGIEKAKHRDENIADVKAAEKMAKLFDEIKKDNPDSSPEFVHGLNVFLSRLLFCFFAEDTNIFEENQFTNALDAHTKVDGRDLANWFDTFFEVLDTNNNKRKNLPAYLDAFPYVNGSLFTTTHHLPIFTRRARQAIIDAGSLEWKDINPDIFGSMFQAVIGADQRGSLGQHYTSVPNIMKVIEPLFLNDLYEAYDKTKGDSEKIIELLNRLAKIKIFDPACGSGNFLIIAYKELRILEMKIFKESGMMALSGITLSQFYGIELDDFAHEIATLALWLAEHQMNVAFFNEFGQTNPTLPLKEAGHIVQANACRIDWEEVCPKGKTAAERSRSEIYILGNPPYLGARNQNIVQKEDMNLVFRGMKGSNSLDYVACWFKKGSDFILDINSKAAFVSTNSICQGEQVSLLWADIFKNNIEISFAHRAFRWTNNAKNSAVVAVVIVGVCNVGATQKKMLFFDNVSRQVKNISPYLTENSNLLILKRSIPLSEFSPLVFGNQSLDGGNLILNNDEKNKLVENEPGAQLYLRRFHGGKDFMNGEIRWCIWINNLAFPKANLFSELNSRIMKVLEFRRNGGQVARSLVDTPYRFRYTHEANVNFLAIPRNTSVRRHYMSIDIKPASSIASETLQVIYDCEPYMLGVLSSRIHMLWVKSVAGGMKTDILYSNTICYNAFPFLKISTQRKNEITQCVFRILEEREKHSEKTMAELYDPNKMPEDLREAHRQNDLAIERCYRSRPFTSDEERLEYLFKLYEKMIAEEEEKNSFSVKEKKTRKKRT